YGVPAVEDACAVALDIGVHEYRFVRRYLERRPHPQMFLRQIDPLIREPTEYRDFINLKIKEQPDEPHSVKSRITPAALGSHGGGGGDRRARSPREPR